MANPSWLRIGPGHVTVQIRARPGAGRQRIVRADDRVLFVVTGNGLKDVAGASRKAPEAYRIGASLDECKRALGLA